MLAPSLQCSNEYRAAAEERKYIMSMVTSPNTSWLKNALIGLQTYVSNHKAAAKIATARRAKYRETYSELSALSDRDLNDIGVARSDIHWLATQESMKAANA